MAETREDRDRRHWEAIEEAGELLLEHRFEQALVELKRILSEDPNNPYAFNLLGNALWELEQLEPARDAFRAAILLAPNFLGARVGLSNCLRQLGAHEEAERQARVALERFPKDGDAMHALGLALAARGKRGEARLQLEGFLDAHPEVEAQAEVRQILELLGFGQEGEPLEFE